MATSDPRALIGRWRMDRRVADRWAGLTGRMSGMLTVEDVGDGELGWSEEGILRWAGHDLPVARRLALRPIDGAWWMTFADGRLFHPWQPGQPVVHPCGADTYHGVVAVDHAVEIMRILWRVCGPNKDQRLFTRCRRKL